MAIVAALLIGLVFGLGITLAGMINPAKILNFFDLAGDWDPSLALVMAAALLVTGIGYRLVWPLRRPLLDLQFHLPNRKDLDLPLIGGSALFGLGWGIAGFCPGGAIPALGLGESSAAIFSASMLSGMFLMRLLRHSGRKNP